MRQLHSKFTEAIAQRFNVLATIDLFEYDQSPKRLHSTLSKLKKDTYSTEDRIVFLHFDTEYYPDIDAPGFLITNLHMILASLDIPFSFILLITNHTNIRSQLLHLKDKFASQEPSHLPFVVTNFQQLLVDDGSHIKNIDLNANIVKYSYSCLNGVGRTHRKFLVSMLKSYSILKFGLVSFKQ